MLANRIGPNAIGPRLVIVELQNKLCRVRGQATGLHAVSDATCSFQEKAVTTSLMDLR
ncbi:MAG: hypothetical protein QOJ51_4095, partial [Acidobacteriaceae bacterium]|nr:hypothetical protein [Acidobacteriaceae bacterium]